MPERASLLAAAIFLEKYLRFVAGRSKFKVHTPRTTHGPVDTSELKEIFDNHPLLVTFWNAHSLLLLCAWIGLQVSSILQERIVAVADDSPGGLLTHMLYNRLHISGQMLSVESPERRLIDLKTILSKRPNLIMAADSHGPYRSINLGLARLVRSYDCNVRPISARATRSFPIFRRIRMAVPLPSAVIHVSIGSIVRWQPADPLKAIAGRLQEGLVDLDSDLSLAVP